MDGDWFEVGEQVTAHVPGDTEGIAATVVAVPQTGGLFLLRFARSGAEAQWPVHRIKRATVGRCRPGGEWGPSQVRDLAERLSDGRKPDDLADAIRTVMLHGAADDDAEDYEWVLIRSGRCLGLLTPDGIRHGWIADTEAAAASVVEGFRRHGLTAVEDALAQGVLRSEGFAASILR